MTKRWRRGFEVARAARLHSNFKAGFQIGAALYSGSRLLSIGFNVWKTHPKSRDGSIEHMLHAEMAAILKRQYYPGDGNLVLYTFRETLGKPACSKPCGICMPLIKAAGIKAVRYINKEGQEEEIKLR